MRTYCSDWSYPSLECRSCREYGNHATVLPTPGAELLFPDGICPGETALHRLTDEEVEQKVDAACDIINHLTELMMFGDGEQCTKASTNLALIGKAMALNVHKER